MLALEECISYCIRVKSFLKLYISPPKSGCDHRDGRRMNNCSQTSCSMSGL